MCGEVAQGKDGSGLTCVKERLPRLPVLETLWTPAGEVATRCASRRENF